ncbi:type IIL restriction-modification enzyme MmeI [Nocardiopsis metallicus]|uniref:type IIL restriction-modification enzyme MmeI n=1 Tax=Nocardiopsis metallicus TaxID=179819 RepID=UPI00160FECB5
MSDTGVPLFVRTGQVFNEKIVVFATGENSRLALLSSVIHGVWARKYSSTRTSDLQYTPSKCFETFPMPSVTSRMEELGGQLNDFRRNVMQKNQLGLTPLYGKVHDPDCEESEILQLRRINGQIDETVKEAYGWTDLELGLGFHETPKGVRLTVSEAVRVEILDRLLQLNFERHKEEERKGIWPPKRKSRKRAEAKKAAPPVMQDGLFPPEGTLF